MDDDAPELELLRREQRRRAILTIAVTAGVLALAAGGVALWRYRSAATEASEFEDSIRRGCELTSRCSTNRAAVEACIAGQRRNGFDEPARQLIVDVNRKVLAACGSASCSDAAACAMDTLAELSGEAAHPIEPALRAAIDTKFCEVAAENGGYAPALDQLGATAKQRELKGLLAQVHGVATVAEVLKEAIASCRR